MTGMTVSAVCFCILLALSGLLLLAGRWLGERGPRTARTGLVVAFLLVALAAVPKFRPALLHTICPLSISIWLEGVLATFPWMVLVGALWTGPFGKRVNRAGPLMLVLGLVYYAFGGVWMVLPNVEVAVQESRTARGITLQSRQDTCAPAACATALRMMGIETTEGEMCHVVMAKPGRGSTLARAAYGLRQHLKRRGIGVSLEGLSAEEVLQTAQPDRPILVVIRSNIAADHMVVVLGRVVILGSDQDGVVIANPAPGEHGGVESVRIDAVFGYGYFGFEVFTLDDFARLYRGGAIVFEFPAESEDNADPSGPPSSLP